MITAMRRALQDAAPQPSHGSTSFFPDPLDKVAAVAVEIAFTMAGASGLDRSRVLDLVALKARRLAVMARGGTSASYPL